MAVVGRVVWPWYTDDEDGGLQAYLDAARKRILLIMYVDVAAQRYLKRVDS